MSQLNFVKRLSLISILGLVFTSPAQSSDEVLYKAWKFDTSFECGIYEFSGKLTSGDHASYILTLRSNSSSAIELILLGGNVAKRLSKVGTNVTVIAYVPKVIKNNNRPMVFVQKFIKAKEKQEEYRMIQKEKCGLSSYFKE